MIQAGIVKGKPAFERVKDQLWNVLNSLTLETSHSTSTSDQFGSYELRDFDRSKIERYLRKNNFSYLRDQDDNFHVSYLRDPECKREVTARLSLTK
jgi:hypothetical protein